MCNSSNLETGHGCHGSQNVHLFIDIGINAIMFFWGEDLAVFIHGHASFAIKWNRGGGNHALTELVTIVCSTGLVHRRLC